MLKKTFLVVLSLVSFLLAQADIIVHVPAITTATPGTNITIPITINGASSTGTPISSANLYITYDTAALKYTGLTNFNSLMPANQWFYSGNNGIVAANWLEPNLLTVAVPEGGTLFEIKFQAKPGACALTFTTFEFTDALYNTIPTQPDNGKYASIQQVTFKVDMRDQTVSPNGVHLAGSFNNWSPTATAMNLLSGTVYAASVNIVSDSLYPYRFVNGNTTSNFESVPVACGVPSTFGGYDRSILNSDGDSVLTEVCFSSCVACPPLYQVTFKVDMSNEVINPNGVHLAGSFNNWSTSATPLSNLGNNVFGITLPFATGTFLTYRFVNGNTTSNYEIVPAECGVAAGGNLYNRFFTVQANDTALVAVCYGSCAVCPPKRLVTFQVDMSQETISPNGIHIAGSFNGFSPSANEMTNLGNNVFTYTQEFTENDFITFWYINGNSSADAEIVPEACGTPHGGGYARFLLIPDVNTVLPEVCFGNCTDCQGAAGYHDITFFVDLSKETVSPQGVYLSGSFNNWSLNANAMMYLGNGLYRTILSLPENTQQTYRFVNGAVNEVVPNACGVSTSSGLARSITIPTQSFIIDTVCFGMCTSCPPSTYKTVKFAIDMQKQDISLLGVHLAGSFNNWDPAATEMTSAGQGVYEVELQLIEGKTELFRYVNGNTVVEMEEVPSECGVLYSGNDYARSITTNADTILEPICFASCYPCDVSTSELNISECKVFPIPAHDYIMIVIPPTSPTTSIEVVVYDNVGRQSLKQDLVNESNFARLDLSGLPNGLYILQISISKEHVEYHKLLITRF